MIYRSELIDRCDRYNLIVIFMHKVIFATLIIPWCREALMISPHGLQIKSPQIMQTCEHSSCHGHEAFW